MADEVDEAFRVKVERAIADQQLMKEALERYEPINGKQTLIAEIRRFQSDIEADPSSRRRNTRQIAKRSRELVEIIDNQRKRTKIPSAIEKRPLDDLRFHIIAEEVQVGAEEEIVKRLQLEIENVPLENQAAAREAINRMLRSTLNEKEEIQNIRRLTEEKGGRWRVMDVGGLFQRNLESQERCARRVEMERLVALIQEEKALHLHFARSIELLRQIQTEHYQVVMEREHKQVRLRNFFFGWGIRSTLGLIILTSFYFFLQELAKELPRPSQTPSAISTEIMSKVRAQRVEELIDRLPKSLLEEEVKSAVAIYDGEREAIIAEVALDVAQIWVDNYVNIVHKQETGVCGDIPQWVPLWEQLCLKHSKDLMTNQLAIIFVEYFRTITVRSDLGQGTRAWLVARITESQGWANGRLIDRETTRGYFKRKGLELYEQYGPQIYDAVGRILREGTTAYLKAESREEKHDIIDGIMNNLDEFYLWLSVILILGGAGISWFLAYPKFWQRPVYHRGAFNRSSLGQWMRENRLLQEKDKNMLSRSIQRLRETRWFPGS